MPGPFGFTNAFTSGELDDDAWDRTDLQQVAKGCAQAQNLMVRIAGPLAKRPGFWLIGPVSDPAHNTRIVAFRKSWTDSLLLEFGNLVCHVWTAFGQPFIDTGTGLQLSFATPFPGSMLPVLRWKQVQDVIYFRAGDGSLVPQTLSRASGGLVSASWTFTPTTFLNGPWLSENTDLTQTVTLAQTGGPAEIDDGNNTTLAGTIPVGASVTLTASNPMFSAALVGSQMRLRANLNSVSCLAWAPAYKYFVNDFAVSNGNMYYCPDIGAPGTSVTSGNNPPVQLQGTQSDGAIVWTFLHDGAGIVKLTGYTSPTVMTGTVYHAVPLRSNVATSYWAFAAYSPADGWPTAWPEIREERLVDGATSGNLDWADLTQTAGFNPTQEDFTPGTGLGVVVDSNAVRRRVGTKGGRIQWFHTATYLLVGTETGEHLISGPVLDEPISPGGVVIKDLSEFGCAPIEPANSQRGLMFVTITGKTLREISVDPSQGTIGEDHSYLAQHIASRNFARIKFTKSPSNNLWAQLGDGGLACYTYQVEQQVKGWTSQLLPLGLTVTDMAVTPSYFNFETLWVVASSPSIGKVLLQLSDPPSGLYMDVANNWFAPGGVPTNTIAVKPLLNGQAIDVLADGAWYANLLVTGGQVTLPAGVTALSGTWGLTYPVAFTSLKLDLRNLYGGALLQAQDITEALVDVETVLCTVNGGNPNWPGEDVSTRLASDVPAAVARRVTKRVTIVQNESSETDDHDPRITITEQSPYPFVLYAIRQDKVAIGE
jgi:hypothetical protein